MLTVTGTTIGSKPGCENVIWAEPFESAITSPALVTEIISGLSTVPVMFEYGIETCEPPSRSREKSSFLTSPFIVMVSL